MADLIDRAAAKKQFSNVLAYMGKEIKATLDRAPAVSIEREGEWRITEYEFFDCSVCGGSYYTGAESRAQAESYLNSGKAYKYCPNCGAKMRGV